MDDLHPELKWILLALVALWVLWFFFGGPERYNQNEGPFLNSPAPINNSSNYPISN